MTTLGKGKGNRIGRASGRPQVRRPRSGIGPLSVPPGLVRMMEKYGVSSAELARRLNTTQSNVSLKIRGHTVISWDDMLKIAGALNVPVDWLVK